MNLNLNLAEIFNVSNNDVILYPAILRIQLACNVHKGGNPKTKLLHRNQKTRDSLFSFVCLRHN